MGNFSTYDTQSEEPVIRSGLAFLDMRVEDHFRLLALLQQAADANAYFCGKIDIQALWKFFFDSSFIYPEKYKFIQSNKDTIKATYQKLYNKSSGISSHFIYQKNGQILAHTAMLRFYERSWLIHHHAAVRSNNPLAGLQVLYNVSHFIMAGHRLDSLKMDYVFCYYQPGNKFPAHVFGGTAARINNPQICSVDNFAYYHHHSRNESTLPDGWFVRETNEDDLRDLANFYEAGWNGLLLRALQLEAGQTGCTMLKQDFRKFGLRRERHLLSLYYQGRLCAIFLVNQSDLGLNMSDLTNAITAIVVHPGNLTREIFATTIQHFEQYYRLKEIPVMIFPARAAQKIGLALEKTYCLWVYNTENLDHYFRCLQRYFKFAGNRSRKRNKS